MPGRDDHGNGGAGRPAADDTRPRGPAPGSSILLHGASHRVLAIVAGRVLLTSHATHHPFLVQDADGSIQLPTLGHLVSMIDAGTARAVEDDADPCPSARMTAQIELLDTLGVVQGEKAIWIALAAHWTPALRAQFGPHDPPWKIKRWRAALRKALAASE